MKRTNNDTWDLATSVGATATMVAAARATASNIADPLISDPLAEPLVRAVGIDAFTRWATGELAAADVDPDATWGLQPLTDAIAARTRYFDAFCLGAMAAGIRQAVILASGLDTRAYRLPWPPAMAVFEIDQPEVVEFKTATLTGLGAEPTADLRMVPIDLRRDWPAALQRAGFDTDRPTAWIAEGLFPYLPPDGQDRLLDNITALSAIGSRLATETFMGGTTPVDVAEERMRNVARGWREHGIDIEIPDLAYLGERNDVATYLGSRGWDSAGTTMRDLLAANGLPAISETNHEASLADNRYYTSIYTHPHHPPTALPA
ncbi:class I SAM-dependent methyltransferase [Nocardia sp. NPDC004711]